MRRRAARFLSRRGTARQKVSKAAALVGVLALLSGLLTWPDGVVQQAYAGDWATNSGNYQVRLTASPNPAQEGDTITWVIEVQNLRSSSASNRYLLDHRGYTSRPNLPCAPTIDVGGTSGWTLRSGYSNHWYLNPGATGTYTCTSTAPAPGSYTYSAIPTAKGTTGTAADSPSGYGWWNGGTGINYNSGTGQVTATETLVVEEPAVADLAVAKTVSPNTTVAAGEDVTYTITVSNEGADSTSTYTLTDTIPSSFTDIRVTSPATGCTVDQTTRVVTCANQAVPSGTATNTYTILAKATTAGATSNTATVSKLPEETVTDNNTSAPATVTVQQADLTVTKTASKPTYLTGEKATWTVTVTNTNAPNSTTSSTYTLEDIVPRSSRMWRSPVARRRVLR